MHNKIILYALMDNVLLQTTGLNTDRSCYAAIAVSGLTEPKSGSIPYTLG